MADLHLPQPDAAPRRLTAWLSGGLPHALNFALKIFIARYTIPALLAAGLHAAIFLSPAASKKNAYAHGGGEPTKYAEIQLADTSAPQSGNTDDSSSAAPPPTSDALAAAAKNALTQLLARDADDVTVAAHGNEPAAFLPLTHGLENGGAFDALAALHGTGAVIDASGFTGAFSCNRPGAGRALAGTARGGHGAGTVAISFMPAPPYPEIARREKRQGIVELAVAIDTAGRACEVTISSSSGHADLDESARATVLHQWRFQRIAPAKEIFAGGGGELRECLVKVTFNLERT